MAEDNLMAIFDLSPDSVDTYDQEQTESVLYRPSPESGKGGIYSSLIRFLPNPENPKKSITRKFVYWLTDDEGNSSYYDSPTTVAEKCPVQTMFFKLRNSDSAVDKKMSEDLKRREVFYSLVQIIKDPHNPDLEGKIKIFKYGYKIKQKIDEELKPKFSTPTQIFDLFAGKNFELTLTKQAGFNNYDSSKFQGNTSAIEINGAEMEKTKDNMKIIIDYLKDAPKLSDFEFKSWDDAIRSKIENILNRYRSHGSSVDVLTSTKFEPANTPKQEASVPNVPQSEDLGTGSGTETPKGEDDLDSFLKDLNIS